MDKEKIEFLFENMTLEQQFEVMEILVKQINNSIMWAKKKGKL